MGRFEQANGGTLFLDEIGDMPASAQTRLLRVLAENEFYRAGGHQSVKVDVRIIAATHQDLETLVEQGKFREDLFHRLNVIRVHVPSLAQRREDIPLLAQYFLDNVAKELGDEPKRLDADTADYHGAALAGQRAAVRKYLPLVTSDGQLKNHSGGRPTARTAGRRRV